MTLFIRKAYLSISISGFSFSIATDCLRSCVSETLVILEIYSLCLRLRQNHSAKMLSVHPPLILIPNLQLFEASVLQISKTLPIVAVNQD